MPDQRTEMRQAVDLFRQACKNAGQAGAIDWDALKVLIADLLQEFGPILVQLLIGLLLKPKH